MILLAYTDVAVNYIDAVVADYLNGSASPVKVVDSQAELPPPGDGRSNAGGLLPLVAMIAGSGLSSWHRWSVVTDCRHHRWAEPSPGTFWRHSTTLPPPVHPARRRRHGDYRVRHFRHLHRARADPTRALSYRCRHSAHSSLGGSGGGYGILPRCLNYGRTRFTASPSIRHMPNAPGRLLAGALSCSGHMSGAAIWGVASQPR